MAEPLNNAKTVFKTKVNDRLARHPDQWAGDDSVEVVRSLVDNLTDDKGNPIVLTDEEEAVIQLASRPTQEVQMKVITTIVNRHQATLDPATEDLIKRVINAAAFKIELAKAGKIKDEKATKLNNLLA